MTYTTAVKEFSDACNDDSLPSTPKQMSVEAVEFIAEMVNDELEELREATDVVEQADALVDAIYYICDNRGSPWHEPRPGVRDSARRQHAKGCRWSGYPT